MSTSYAFVLSLLALASGCGENVLLGNWELRSSTDAGLELPTEADAGRNKPAEKAERARERARVKSEQKAEHDSRPNDEKSSH